MSKATEAAAALLATIPRRQGPHLTFQQQCAGYCAVQMGFPQNLIAKALGVTQVTMSNLASCMKPERARRRGSRPRAYQDVAKAFDELGETAFRERYYTDEFHAMMVQLVRDRIPPSLPVNGPTPRACKWAGRHVVATPQGDVIEAEVLWAGAFSREEFLEHYFVETYDPRPEMDVRRDGWTYRFLNDRVSGDKPVHYRFKRSDEACDQLYHDLHAADQNPRK